MKSFLLLVVICLNVQLNSFASDTARVLFIGNSYTAVNDLPNMIQNMASADGNILIYQANTPGGYTFQQHTTNPTTLSLIAQGTWDYVVLQEQSQLPSFPDAQVQAGSLPYAKILDSLIHSYNPCTKSLFYMTWGRKNGDQDNCPSFPPLCTYEGMDSLLQLRYTMMAEASKAYLSPVGVVWHAIRDQNPAINLYQQDESHPSEAGTFVAAATFYATIFKNDLQSNSFNGNISSANAQLIKNAVKEHVFDSLAYWSRFVENPVANFDFIQTDAEVSFQNQSQLSTEYFWDFGDGNTSNQPNPVHTFDVPGTYNVCLTAKNANCRTQTFCEEITVLTTSISDFSSSSFFVYPNPAKQSFQISGTQGKFAFTVSDLQGRIIEKGTMELPALLNCSQWTTGVYFLKLQNEKGVQESLKLLKQDN